MVVDVRTLVDMVQLYLQCCMLLLARLYGLLWGDRDLIVTLTEASMEVAMEDHSFVDAVVVEERI